MDFENIEKLTEEEMEDTYNDMLACYCKCDGAYIGDLLYGYCFVGAAYHAGCLPACRNRCGNGASYCYCDNIYNQNGSWGAICYRV